MKKNIILLLLAIITVSCSVDNGISLNNEIVSFSINTNTDFSRTNTVDYSTSFSNGDIIGLFIYDTQQGCRYNNLKLIYDEVKKTWVPDGGDLILKLKDESLKYYAYYPYNSEFNNYMSIPHSVEVDQSNETNFNNSDFLTATSETSETNVSLVFSHVLSYVEVTVEGDKVIDEVYLNGVEKTLTYDFTSSSVSEIYSIEDNKIRMQRIGEGNIYRAVVPEQKINANSDFLQVISGGMKYSFKNNQDLDFSKGKVIKLKVNLSESLTY